MVGKKYRSRIGFKIQICQPQHLHRPPPGDSDKKLFFKKKAQRMLCPYIVQVCAMLSHCLIQCSQLRHAPLHIHALGHFFVQDCVC